MGKSKHRERQNDRTNPISKPIKPPTDPELAAIRETRVLPVIGDLTSPESSKHSAAASAIANAIEDTKFRKLLLREQVVHILLKQIITDSALESKCAGFGILRNLVLEEESDFCVYLYRQDILTAVQAIVKTIIHTIESQQYPVSKLPKIQQQFLWNLTDSVIGLISSLAEAQDGILDTISKIDIIPNFLFGLLSFKSVPEDLFLSILVCLTTLTEDNEQIGKQIAENETWLKGLVQLREHGGPKAVAACGVLHNLFSTLEWFDHNSPVEGASDAMLIPTLVHYMSEVQVSYMASKGPGASAPGQILNTALEITASIATTLQEALEHASRNEKDFEGFGDVVEELEDAMVEDIASQQGGKGSTKDEALDDNEEMDDVDVEADMALVAGSDRDNCESLDCQPTLEALIRTATPVIINFISYDDLNVRNSALSALNNISWTISSIDFETTSQSLYKLWISTAQKIWSGVVSPVLASDTADIDLASLITSIAWAIARSAKGQVELQGDEPRKFMALYQASKGLHTVASHSNGNGKSDEKQVDAFQGLGVKCIGVLGRLAQAPAPVKLNREIGIFLLTVLTGLPDVRPADAVEALNQVFDIYADKEFVCDQVFWNDGFYKHLESIAPNARKMAKSIDKRKQTELRDRIDETNLNLTRFLAYKRKERGRL